jgi:hypothetical protein
MATKDGLPLEDRYVVRLVEEPGRHHAGRSTADDRYLHSMPIMRFPHQKWRGDDGYRSPDDFGSGSLDSMNAVVLHPQRTAGR